MRDIIWIALAFFGTLAMLALGEWARWYFLAQ